MREEGTPRGAGMPTEVRKGNCIERERVCYTQRILHHCEFAQRINRIDKKEDALFLQTKPRVRAMRNEERKEASERGNRKDDLFDRHSVICLEGQKQWKSAQETDNAQCRNEVVM